ncbi:hypothetical protein [Persephonella sp.]
MKALKKVVILTSIFFIFPAFSKNYFAYAISFGEIKEKIEDIISNFNPVERKIRELESLKADLEIRKQQLRNEVRSYMFSHKTATACLVATGSTAVVYLSKDLSLDENVKEILALITAGCVVYMIANAKEMAEVVDTYINYANQLSNIQESIKEVDNQIQRLRNL